MEDDAKNVAVNRTNVGIHAKMIEDDVNTVENDTENVAGSRTVVENVAATESRCFSVNRRC